MTQEDEGEDSLEELTVEQLEDLRRSAVMAGDIERAGELAEVLARRTGA
jgi:hypothetical protein